MKILLTGANGYIGMRLLPQLLDAGHEVICAVRDPKRLSVTDDLLERIKVITIDFSDITGYQYHSGLVFSAYTDGFTAAIAHGGRYDNLNESLGLKRPATGFSLDLRYLVNNL